MARGRLLNRFLAAALALGLAAGPVLADEAALDDLFARLPQASEGEARRITAAIWAEWSLSGSPAMDLLLARGRAAMGLGDLAAAIDHFSALIDHAPDFAEGYNARATAYFQVGAHGLSVADIARTLELNPRHFGALSGLGMIYERLGRPQSALQAYEAALSFNPHLSEVEASVRRLKAELAGQEL